MSLPDWLEPLPGAAEQRALDEWAIGERGIPGLELMERAGDGLAELVVRASRRRARSPSSAARATTAATAWSPLGCFASSGATSGCCCSRAPEELRGDARTNCERLPGAAARAL